MKKQDQFNVSLSKEEFEAIKILKKKYCINISQFFKNCVLEKLKELENNKN